MSIQMSKSPHPPVHRRLTDRIRDAITDGTLPAGARLPSVRALARTERVSNATAARVYAALTAGGLVCARRGSGYRVALPLLREGLDNATAAADAVWERRLEAPGQRIRVDAGGGWLPTAWQYVSGVQAALREIAREPHHTEGYGSPNGYEPLRALFARQLAQRGIRADPNRIVLTQGASQALDLVVRTILQPGDTVVVEDPAYPPLLELLRARGVRLLGIPRLGTGPDTDLFERILKRRRVRAIYTNTTLQNPTGTTTSPDVAHRLVSLAEQYDVIVLEDDIFGELSGTPSIPLAALGDTSRILHVSSISKSVSPSLRVGFVLVGEAHHAAVVRLKTLSALASSELSERIAFAALSQPHYRRHLAALRQRLAASQNQVQQTLQKHGVELAHLPASGMFLWGCLPSPSSAGRLWQDALESGVLLAPGESFTVNGRASRWWRFNVAHCDDGALSRFLVRTRAGNSSGESGA